MSEKALSDALVKALRAQYVTTGDSLSAHGVDALTQVHVPWDRRTQVESAALQLDATFTAENRLCGVIHDDGAQVLLVLDAPDADCRAVISQALLELGPGNPEQLFARAASLLEAGEFGEPLEPVSPAADVLAVLLSDANAELSAGWQWCCTYARENPDVLAGARRLGPEKREVRVGTFAQPEAQGRQVP
jgi:hypothetical protein